jgi:Sec-independent protein secretion pathway component TatC
MTPKRLIQHAKVRKLVRLMLVLATTVGKSPPTTLVQIEAAPTMYVLVFGAVVHLDLRNRKHAQLTQPAHRERQEVLQCDPKNCL